MVLKQHRQNMLYALIGCISLGGVYSLYTIACGVRSNVRRAVISYDPYLAPVTHMMISDILQKALQEKKQATAIHADVRQTFPHIKQITIKRYQPGQSSIKLTTERPFLLVKKPPSEHFIISEQGTCTPAQYYNSTTTTGLASVVVAGEEQFTLQDQKELFSWARRLPNTFFDLYSVEWKKKTAIILRDKQDPRFTVVTASHIPIEPHIVEKLAYIRTHTPEKKNVKEWQADIRFNKQIVLSETKKNKGKQ